MRLLQTDRMPCRSQHDGVRTAIFLNAALFVLMIFMKEVNSQQLQAMVGENITLPCYVTPPNDTVNDMLEWARHDLTPRFVHVRRFGKNRLVDQNPSYKNRTSVSVDGLKQGDMSLKLHKVKLSDEGTYKCFVPGRKKESSVQLVVRSFSSPVISLAGIDKGTVVLQCESRGWYPKPEVLWLDSEGNLLSAGPTETVRGSDDLYTVSSRVTVEKRHRKNITCRIQQNGTRFTRETQIQVPETSRSFSSTIIVVVVVILLSVLVVAVFGWKWRLNKISEPEKRKGHDEESQEGTERKNNATDSEKQSLINQTGKDECLSHRQTRNKENEEEEEEEDKENNIKSPNQEQEHLCQTMKKTNKDLNSPQKQIKEMSTQSDEETKEHGDERTGSEPVSYTETEKETINEDINNKTNLLGERTGGPCKAETETDPKKPETGEKPTTSMNDNKPPHIGGNGQNTEADEEEGKKGHNNEGKINQTPTVSKKKADVDKTKETKQGNNLPPGGDSSNVTTREEMSETSDSATEHPENKDDGQNTTSQEGTGRKNNATDSEREHLMNKPGKDECLSHSETVNKENKEEKQNNIKSPNEKQEHLCPTKMKTSKDPNLTQKELKDISTQSHEETKEYVDERTGSQPVSNTETEEETINEDKDNKTNLLGEGAGGPCTAETNPNKLVTGEEQTMSLNDNKPPHIEYGQKMETAGEEGTNCHNYENMKTETPTISKETADVDKTNGTEQVTDLPPGGDSSNVTTREETSETSDSATEHPENKDDGQNTTSQERTERKNDVTDSERERLMSKQEADECLSHGETVNQENKEEKQNNIKSPNEKQEHLCPTKMKTSKDPNSPQKELKDISTQSHEETKEYVDERTGSQPVSNTETEEATINEDKDNKNNLRGEGTEGGVQQRHKTDPKKMNE